MSVDANRPITTETKLSAPLNGTLYSTVRTVASEKPTPLIGTSMAGELGPAFADSYVVASSSGPIKSVETLTITHYRNIPIETQELTNFEFRSVDFGGNKFDYVVRTYVFLRSAFDEDSPAVGSAMSVAPGMTFNGLGYTLVSRDQSLSGSPIEPTFITERRIYAKRVELSQVVRDLQTGKGKRSTTKIYARGELIDGVAIEVRAGDPGNSYWGQNGLVDREFDQLSEDWWSVTVSDIAGGSGGTGDEGGPNSPENPARVRFKDFVTPDIRDYVLRETGQLSDPPLEYRTPHYDTTNYPGYVLSYQRPSGESGLLYEFFYAKVRADQELYNYEVTGSDVLVRSYIFPRENYPADFDTIPVTTEDTEFPRYGFTHEIISRADQSLDGVFVMVQRFYQQIVKVEQLYDDDLDCDVTRTTRIIPAGTGSASSAPTQTVEISPVNTFYDLEITSQAHGTYPRQLPTLPKDIPYQFPPLLQGMTLVTAWAWANSTSAAESYSEDWYFNYDLIEPTVGPYEARVLRFVAEEIDAYRDTYPIQKIVTKRETIGIARAWYKASTKGNSTFAEARQIEIPTSIHGEISITNADSISVGQSTNTLPATPGFAGIAAMGVMTVGYQSTKTRYGLYLIEIIQINSSGVYNGVTTPIGGGGNTGAGDPPPAKPVPVITSLAISSDNLIVSGVCTPYSSISVYLEGTEYGRAASDVGGAFSATLSKKFLDIKTLNVRAQLSGVYSTVYTIPTNDLAPEAPSASIAATLDSVTGLSEPSATIHISLNGDSPVNVTANSITGIYTKTFSPILVSGDVLTITAEDGGGISPPTIVIASANPPVLTSAAFPEDVYDTIEGVASEGSKVIAKLAGVQIGFDIAGPTGFSITLDKNYIHGEVIRVTAVENGNENVASASIDVTAYTLVLAAPTPVLTSLGYVGTAPEFSTEIIVIYPDGSENPATLYTNRQYNFTVPDLYNSEKYLVIARYPEGDSDPFIITMPYVPLEAPEFLIAFPQYRKLDNTIHTPSVIDSGWPSSTGDPLIFVIGVGPDGSGLTPYNRMLALVNPNNDPGTIIRITFPGQPDADIVDTDGAAAFYLGNQVPGRPYIEDPIGSGLWYYIDPSVTLPDSAYPGATPYPTLAQIKAAVPPLIEVTVTTPDGRTVTAGFDRSNHFLYTP